MYKKFNYDKESGVSTAILKDGHLTAVGRAKLHPDDEKYGNQLTGLMIAEMRAYKKLVEKRKKNKAATAKWLRAQAEYYEKLVQEDESLIKDVGEEISVYIESKSKLYSMFKNPPETIKWEEVDEDFFSESFKRSVSEGKALE